MLKKIFITGAVISLSACISIETPEHLVSDTIEAGKDVYYSVKEKMSEKESNSTKTFSHQYLITAGELLGESSGKCIDHAVDTARKSLNIYNIDIQNTTSAPKTLNGQSFIECSIVVGNNV